MQRPRGSTGRVPRREPRREPRGETGRPPRRLRSGARRRRPVAVGAAAVVLASVALAGCTSQASEEAPTPSEGGTETVRPLAVRAPVTKVAGRLGDRDRLALRRDVEALLGRYVTAAFLQEGGRLVGFTDGAAREARSTGAVLTAADLGGGPLRARSVTAAVNAFAPRGTAVGATARVEVRLVPAEPDEPGDQGAGPVRLEGRLLLTRVGPGWKIFGFDVRRTTA